MIAYLLIIAVAFSVVGVSLIQLVGEYMFNQRIKEDQRIADSLAERVCVPFAALNAYEMIACARETCQEPESARTDSRFARRGAGRYGFSTAAASDLNLAESANGSLRIGVRLRYLRRGQRPTVSALTATVNVFTAGSDMKGVFASAIHDGDRLLGVAIYVSRVQEIYRQPP